MANPAFNEDTYDRFGQGNQQGYGYGYGQAQAPVQEQTEVMTVTGTLNKTLILFALVLAGASVTWATLLAGNVALALPLAFGGLIGALIVGMITAFRPKSSAITAPIYGVLEGLFLGGWSALIQLRYGNVVGPAVAMTVLVAGIMLGIYRSGLIKVTEKLKFGIVAATAAIAVAYTVSNLMLVFGHAGLANFFWGTSLLSIGVSILTTGVAAFNLLLDFDTVEYGVERRAPKFMEWYASYGIMVTLVWIYLELLRLLAKFSRR